MISSTIVNPFDAYNYRSVEVAKISEAFNARE